MKTLCVFRDFLRDHVGDTAAAGAATPACMENNCLVPSCIGQRSPCSHCCAVLMLRYIAHHCDDPSALIEDASARLRL